MRLRRAADVRGSLLRFSAGDGSGGATVNGGAASGKRRRTALRSVSPYAHMVTALESGGGTRHGFEGWV